MISIATPTWMESAACASVGVNSDYDPWHPEKGETQRAREARAVCSHCPVAQQCAQFALDNDIHDGIWGGLSPKQRNKLAADPTVPAARKPRKPQPVKPINHGTHGGYMVHRKRGEDACRACKDAEALYGREARQRRQAGAA